MEIYQVETYITKLGKTGVIVNINGDDFIYNFKEDLGDHQIKYTWKQSKTGLHCKAKVIVENGTTVILASWKHVHSAEHAEAKKLRVKKLEIEAIKNSTDIMSVKPFKIYKQLKIDYLDLKFPKFDKIKTAAYNAKKQLFTQRFWRYT